MILGGASGGPSLGIGTRSHEQVTAMIHDARPN